MEYVVGGLILIVAFIAGIAWLRMKQNSSQEPMIGGQPSGRTDEEIGLEHEDEPEEDEDPPYWSDESENLDKHKGDKIPFDIDDWEFEIIGFNDENEEILGNLHITLPPGAKFTGDIDRHLEDGVEARQSGFTITFDPQGPAVGNTLTYDPDLDEGGPYYEDYQLLVDEIFVYDGPSV